MQVPAGSDLHAGLQVRRLKEAILGPDRSTSGRVSFPAFGYRRLVPDSLGTFTQLTGVGGYGWRHIDTALNTPARRLQIDRYAVPAEGRIDRVAHCCRVVNRVGQQLNTIPD
jgi:hypothetical protein